jgi:hypothetical protein
MLVIESNYRTNVSRVPRIHRKTGYQLLTSTQEYLIQHFAKFEILRVQQALAHWLISDLNAECVFFTYATGEITM